MSDMEDGVRFTKGLLGAASFLEDCWCSRCFGRSELRFLPVVAEEIQPTNADNCHSSLGCCNMAQSYNKEREAGDPVILNPFR